MKQLEDIFNLHTLDGTLKYMYIPKSEFIICGDINTDHPNQNYQKKLLTSLLTTYNSQQILKGGKKGIQNNSLTVTDIVNDIQLNSPFTSHTDTGLSDYNVQFLTINNIYAATNTVPSGAMNQNNNNKTINTISDFSRKWNLGISS